METRVTFARSPITLGLDKWLISCAFLPFHHQIPQQHPRIRRSPPPSTMPSDRCQNDACPHEATTTNLQKCTRCKVRTYCSRSCQRVDWRSHKPQCNPPVPLPPMINMNETPLDPTNPHHHLEAFRQAFLPFTDIRQFVSALYDKATALKGRGFLLFEIPNIATLAAMTNLLLKQPPVETHYINMGSLVFVRRLRDVEEYHQLIGKGYFQPCENRADRLNWAMGDHVLNHADGDAVMVVTGGYGGRDSSIQSFSSPEGEGRTPCDRKWKINFLPGWCWSKTRIFPCLQ